MKCVKFRTFLIGSIINAQELPYIFLPEDPETSVHMSETFWQIVLFHCLVIRHSCIWIYIHMVWLHIHKNKICCHAHMYICICLCVYMHSVCGHALHSGTLEQCYIACTLLRLFGSHQFRGNACFNGLLTDERWLLEMERKFEPDGFSLQMV